MNKKKGMILLLIMMFIIGFDHTIYAEPSFWAQNSVEILKANNILSDALQDETKLQNHITREEFADLVVRLYAEVKEVDVEDIKASDPFIDTNNPMVAKAYYLGIVKGTSKTQFAPKQEIARQEIAVMLLRMMKMLEVDVTVYETAKFDDMKSVATWAVEAINFCTQEGIIQGMGDNKVKPMEKTTREQAMVFLHRIANKYAWLEEGKNEPIQDEFDSNHGNREEETESVEEGYELLTTGYQLPKETKLKIDVREEAGLYLRLIAEDRERNRDLREKIDELFAILKINKIPEEILQAFRKKIEDSWTEAFNAPRMAGPFVKELEDGKRIELNCSLDVQVSIYKPFIHINKNKINPDAYIELSTGYKIPKETKLYIKPDEVKGYKLEIIMYDKDDAEEIRKQLNEIFEILEVNQLPQEIIREMEINFSSTWDYANNKPGRINPTLVELPNGDQLVYSANGYVQIKIFTYY